MAQLSEWLKQHQITEVECVTPDFTGIARGKIVPREKFSEEEGMRLPEAVLVQTVTGEFAENVTPATDPDMILVPDPNSIRLVPLLPPRMLPSLPPVTPRSASWMP